MCLHAIISFDVKFVNKWKLPNNTLFKDTLNLIISAYCLNSCLHGIESRSTNGAFPKWDAFCSFCKITRKHKSPAAKCYLQWGWNLGLCHSCLACSCLSSFPICLQVGDFHTVMPYRLQQNHLSPRIKWCWNKRQFKDSLSSKWWISLETGACSPWMAEALLDLFLVIVQNRQNVSPFRKTPFTYNKHFK